MLKIQQKCCIIQQNVEKLCKFYLIFIVVFSQKSGWQFSKIIRVYF